MKMLKIEDLMERLHFGRTTIYRLISNGYFPRGHGDGRYRRWSEAEIDAYTILLWDVPHELPNGIHAETVERLREMATAAKTVVNSTQPNME